MPQNEPTTGAQLEARLEIIRGLIAQGMTQAQVVKYCLDKHKGWKVTDRQLRNYYKATWQHLGNEAAGVDRAAYFVRTLDRLDYIYATAINSGNLRVAREATAELIKLLRLDIPSADFDWRKAAVEAGLQPSEVFERMVNMFMVTDEQETS